MSDLLLQTVAAHLEDVEKLRVATENRLRILTATEPDSDGVARGFGLSDEHPVVRSIMESLEVLQIEENETTKLLQRQMRAHPLGPWVKAQKGVGEKQAARLLAAIGDPYWIDAADFEDEDGNVTHRPEGPRTVGQLWAYAGLVPGQKRRKGVQSNWKSAIKMRAYLVATSCIKSDGPYRKVYDERRAHTAVTHPEWTLGHSHNDALRLISKRLLQDMYNEAKRLH